jgi:outer membrane protein OmpU
MGDTDGAYDWALTEIAWGTTLTDDHTTHAGWNGNQGLDGGLSGQIARYDYTFGDFGIALSAEIGDGTDLPNTTSDDQILAIGGKWSGDWGSTGVSLGLGYQQGGFQTPAVRTGTSTAANLQGAGNAKIFGLSGAFAFQGGFEARLVYSTVDGTITAAGTTTGLNLDAKWDYGGIGFAYVMDEWIVEANWGQYDGTIAGNTVTPTNFKSDGYGVAVNYDLGGGAVAMAGYGRSNPFAANGVNIPSWSTWSIGLGLSF